MKSSKFQSNHCAKVCGPEGRQSEHNGQAWQSETGENSFLIANRQPVGSHEYERIEELARLAAKGCRSSESELVELFTPLVISKCRFYFGIYDEDLVQDGLLRLIELIRSFEPGRGTRFCGYIKFMVSTFYWNRKRSELSKGRLTTGCGKSDDYSQSAKASDDDLAASELKLLVASLPKLQRKLVQLVYFEGLTLLEASKRTGVSYSYAIRIKSQAMESLRLELEGLD